jgi:hypothetical protein
LRLGAGQARRRRPLSKRRELHLDQLASPPIRRAIEEDRFPRAPRLDPLRSALAKLDPAAARLRPLPKAPQGKR